MAKHEKEQKTEEQNIAKIGTTALASIDYGEDAVVADGKEAGRGYEHQGKADVSIPFMNLLQSLSPIVVEGKAKPGDWFNTVTEELFGKDTGFLFVGGTTRRMFTEWTPRDKGGGFRGQHEVESDVVTKAIKNSARFGKYLTDDGNTLNETFYVYGALCDERQALTMAVIPFWSTKIRAYKAWMTRLRQATIVDGRGTKVRPPLYAHLSRVTSVQQKNEKGTFFVPTIVAANKTIVDSLLRPDDERFMMAKACMQLVDSGEAKVDFSKIQDAGDDVGDTSFDFSK